MSTQQHRVASGGTSTAPASATASNGPDEQHRSSVNVARSRDNELITARHPRPDERKPIPFVI